MPEFSLNLNGNFRNDEHRKLGPVFWVALYKQCYNLQHEVLNEFSFLAEFMYRAVRCFADSLHSHKQ